MVLYVEVTIKDSEGFLCPSITLKYKEIFIVI